MSASAHCKGKGKETRSYYPTLWSNWQLDNETGRYYRWRQGSGPGDYEYEFRSTASTRFDENDISVDPSASESEFTTANICSACSESFQTSSERDRHYQTIHSNNGERPHKCLVSGCSAGVQSWSNVEGLRTHNKKWHSDYSDYENSQGLSLNTVDPDSSQAIEPYNQSSTASVTKTLGNMKISGAPGSAEESDPMYRTHNSSEFRFGRVLKVLWAEPKGSDIPKGSSTDTSLSSREGKHGERFQEKVRRFVIIASKDGHSICLPINTYGRQGVNKSGVHARDHTIIYSSKKPVYLPGEKEHGLKRTPIAFIPSSPRDMLDRASRLNYAKPYTIEHNVKVWFIGSVSTDREKLLVSDYNDVNPPITAPSQAPGPYPAPFLASGSYGPSYSQYSQYPTTSAMSNSQYPQLSSGPSSSGATAYPAVTNYNSYMGFSSG